MKVRYIPCDLENIYIMQVKKHFWSSWKNICDIHEGVSIIRLYRYDPENETMNPNIIS